MLSLHFYRIEQGRSLCVHGHVGSHIAPSARVVIGNDFYTNNGKHINPLSRNVQSNIAYNEGRKVIIGDHVGMSSSVIWCHDSIIIENNVQIGSGVVLLDSDCHSTFF